MCEVGLSLSPILSDGVILQRDTINHIYGTETYKKIVRIHFKDTEYEVMVDDNHEFCFDLPPVSAGGPYTMEVIGSGKIVISDILFGDVYLLSGQSNMELPIRRVLDVSEEEISKACEPMIRQYLLPATYQFDQPAKYMYAGSWVKGTGDDLLGFSAVGYFYAKELMDAYHVPIGLIASAVGGCSIDAWMSPDTLSQFGDYTKLIDDYKNINNFNQMLQAQNELVNEWSTSIKQDEVVFTEKENFKEWDTCRVPSLVSDYGTDTFCGSVYLCKEVILEDEPIDPCHIYMGSIIDSDELWINGQLVGKTEYRYPPRKYPIQKGVLKKGCNQITVRIVINSGNGGTIKEKPYYLFVNGRKISLEGEWFYRVGKKSEIPMPTVLFPPKLPVCFYHTVVVPVSKVSIKGVLWYQGESNTQNPNDYSKKFAAMVSDWRKLYGWKVPFIYVQLANYREPLNTEEDTGWGQLREEQRRSLELDQVAMIVAMDVGERYDIHPQNKKAIGVRLAKAAKHLIYHEDIVHSGPLPMKAKFLEKSVIIDFMYLEHSEEEHNLNNFELAGRDGEYHRATAIRRGNYVTVFSDEVEVPISVRYAWCDNPTNINFYNAAGLPAPGFQMDL